MPMLTGVTSRLPEPLTKAAGIAAPLHIDIAARSARAELRLALADRLHSVFEIVAAGDDAWRVERGSVRFGGMGPVHWRPSLRWFSGGSLRASSPHLTSPRGTARGATMLLPRVSGAVFVSELLQRRQCLCGCQPVHARPRWSAGLDLQDRALVTRPPAGHMKVAALQMTSGADVQANLDEGAALARGGAGGRRRALAVLPENFAFMGMRDADKLAVGEAEGRGQDPGFSRRDRAAACGCG